MLGGNVTISKLPKPKRRWPSAPAFLLALWLISAPPLWLAGVAAGWDCQLTVQDGEATPEAVGRLSFVLPTAANATQLQDAGQLPAVVQLRRLAGPDDALGQALDLSGATIDFVADQRRLQVELDGSLPPGFYEARLDGDLLLMRVPFFAPDSLLLDAAGLPIKVNQYSCPHLVDWNGDGIPDLVVGEKAADNTGRIRLWRNDGSHSSPRFSYVGEASKEGGGSVLVTAGGCLGAYPRLVDWDGDGRPDLLVGLADGTVDWHRNVGTSATPLFSLVGKVMAGDTSKNPIAVGARAAFEVVDWNNDGAVDLLVGGLDGAVRLYRNRAAAGAEPDLRSPRLLEAGGSSLSVPGGRASVAVVDLDADGRQDLLLGNTNGEIYFYRNQGTVAAPVLAAGSRLQAGDGLMQVPDSLPRSRPWAGDLNGDGVPDLLVGAVDGFLHFFQGKVAAKPPPADPDSQPGVDWRGRFLVVGFDGPANVEVDATGQFTAEPQVAGMWHEWRLSHQPGTLHALPALATAFHLPGIPIGETVDVTITLLAGHGQEWQAGTTRKITVAHTFDHLPRLQSARLILAPAGEALQIVTDGWYDYEGAAEQYHYQWFRDGFELPGQTAAELPLEQLLPHRLFHCEVRPFDSATGLLGEPVAEASAYGTWLEEGWNLVYVPTLEAARAAAGRQAERWPRQPGEAALAGHLWRWQPAGLQPGGDFQRGGGFWMHDAGRPRQTWTILLGHGQATAAPQPGWQLFGVAIPTSWAEFAASVHPLTALWQWIPARQAYCQVQADDQLEPGVGYWGWQAQD